MKADITRTKRCYDCPQTIELIENIYNQYYADTYDFYIINYQDDEDYNFIQNYNLSQPLEIVLQQVEDGQMTNFKKLEYLQNQISDPVSFSDNFRYQVNSFFEND